MPLLCTLVALPTAALARTPHGGGSGGSGLGSSGGGSTTTATTSYSPSPTTSAAAANVITLGGVLNASGDGITVTVAASGTQGQPLTISGEAPTSSAGALIAIESARVGHGKWTQVATATIAANGSFSAQWTPSANGQMTLRAVLAPGGTGTSTSTGTSGAGATTTSSSGASGLSNSGGDSASTAAGELSTSALTIPIFKNAIATIYGPGFWGHRTACGQRLTHAMLGVASRTLKCGTQVAVLYRGREITVPVIDRGPFANHASWDLTMATAKALGINETVTIGTLSSASALAFRAGS